MTIKFTCVKCNGKKIDMSLIHIGKDVKLTCKKCGHEHIYTPPQWFEAVKGSYKIK